MTIYRGPWSRGADAAVGIRVGDSPAGWVRSETPHVLDGFSVEIRRLEHSESMFAVTLKVMRRTIDMELAGSELVDLLNELALRL